MRQETFHTHSKITVQPDNWQNFITDGLLSITFYAMKGTYQQTIDPLLLPTSTTDNQVHIEHTTAVTVPAPMLPGHTVAGQTRTVTTGGQPTSVTQHTPITPTQTDVGQTPLQEASAEDAMQMSLKILAFHVDDMGKHMHGLDNNVT